MLDKATTLCYTVAVVKFLATLVGRTKSYVHSVGKKMKKSKSEIANSVKCEFENVRQHALVAAIEISQEKLKQHANRKCGDTFMGELADELDAQFSDYEGVYYNVNVINNNVYITVTPADLFNLLQKSISPAKKHIGEVTSIIAFD